MTNYEVYVNRLRQLKTVVVSICILHYISLGLPLPISVLCTCRHVLYNGAHLPFKTKPHNANKTCEQFRIGMFYKKTNNQVNVLSYRICCMYYVYMLQKNL